MWSYVIQLEQEIGRKVEEHDALQVEVDVACNGDISHPSLSHPALSSAWHIPRCLIKLSSCSVIVPNSGADDSVSVSDDCAVDCLSRALFVAACTWRRPLEC